MVNSRPIGVLRRERLTMVGIRGRFEFNEILTSIFSISVCNLASGNNSDTVLSSSWDKTAKLWDISSGATLATFVGHEAAVWAVVQLKNGNVITGAADKNIIIWSKDGSKVKTVTGTFSNLHPIPL